MSTISPKQIDTSERRSVKSPPPPSPSPGRILPRPSHHFEGNLEYKTSRPRPSHLCGRRGTGGGGEVLFSSSATRQKGTEDCFEFGWDNLSGGEKKNKSCSVYMWSFISEIERQKQLYILRAFYHSSLECLLFVHQIIQPSASSSSRIRRRVHI